MWKMFLQANVGKETVHVHPGDNLGLFIVRACFTTINQQLVSTTSQKNATDEIRNQTHTRSKVPK